MIDKASIESMSEDMVQHIEVSDFNPKAIYFWKGMLAGLLEWGEIDKPTFDRMLNLMPPGPEDQVMHEIFNID